MKGIESCRIFILIFSAQADRSQHVQREVERAFDKGLVVVPFRVEDVRPTGSLEYFLGSVHWLDALTRPMENHLESLVELVKKLVPGRDTGLSAVPDEPLILSSQVENKESSKFELTRRCESAYTKQRAVALMAMGFDPSGASFANCRRPDHP